jgi:arylsulfatase
MIQETDKAEPIRDERDSNRVVPRPADVVFFVVDQLSAKWLECADTGAFSTPNIDRLRARGTTFTRCFASNPVCSPSRATLATGLTSRGHGVLENGYALDPGLPTFMRVLQSSGWRTGAFGKLHYRPHFASLFPEYHQYGFDVVHNTEDARGGEWLDWIAAEHPEHFEEVLSTVWAAGIIPEFARYGPESKDLKAQAQELRKKMGLSGPATDSDGPLPFPAGLSQTEWITRHALQFIHETPKDTPYLAHICYVQPHCPFTPPREYMDSVDMSKIPDPIHPTWPEDPNVPAFLRRQTNLLHGDDWRERRRLYFADIVHLDAQLGRVLDAIEESGRMENTLFVFLSDHGELLYDHGLRRKEAKHYDACIRVPLIIAGSGLRAGVTCDAFVQLEDICPTVMDATGQTMPPVKPENPDIVGPYVTYNPEKMPVLPGKSLLPWCRGHHPKGWRDSAYVESYNDLSSDDPREWARTVRTPNHRFTYYPNGGEQLFDLCADPEEQENCCADPRYSTVRSELLEKLLCHVILQDYPRTRKGLYAFGVH